MAYFGPVTRVFRHGGLASARTGTAYALFLDGAAEGVTLPFTNPP